MNDGIYTWSGHKELDGGCHHKEGKKVFRFSFPWVMLVMGLVMGGMTLAGAFLKRRNGGR